MEYTSFGAMKARDNVFRRPELKDIEKNLMINVDVIQNVGGFFARVY